ncbi:MAG: polysaccharide deacetylase family protein [Eubacteriales bacterium]|nr:polysaccharide deacetylase family protein [Eubacteriales bacterium]
MKNMRMRGISLALTAVLLCVAGCKVVDHPVYEGLDRSAETGAISLATSESPGEVVDSNPQQTTIVVPDLALGTSSIAGEGDEPSTQLSLVDPSEGLTFKYFIDPDFSLVKTSSVRSSEKLCLITFDNVPYGHSLELADALEAFGYRGLFFINGNNLEAASDREIVKQLAERGHSLGCNGRTGANMVGLSESQQRAEIEENIEQIQRICGITPRFYRAPQGDADQTTRAICQSLNLIYVDWSFSYDWIDSYQSKEALLHVILDETPLMDGMNILFHDLSWTAEAMPDLLQGLRERNFRVVNPAEIGPSSSAPSHDEFREIETSLLPSRTEAIETGESQSTTSLN